MPDANQNQSPNVPAPQTMQILVLLKATGDLSGVTPQDLAAYAAAWLRYEDDVAGVPVEVEARLDHADLDLVGLFGAASVAERIGLALELLEGSRVVLRCVKNALESLPPEDRP